MKYTAIFCGGDIKLSGKMVLRKNESHVRSIESHVRKNESQKVFLYKYKPTARDFGKRFGGGKGYEKYRLDKNLELNVSGLSSEQTSILSALIEQFSK